MAEPLVVTEDGDPASVRFGAHQGLNDFEQRIIFETVSNLVVDGYSVCPSVFGIL